jgi:hypothetical protein
MDCDEQNLLLSIIKSNKKYANTQRGICLNKLKTIDDEKRIISLHVNILQKFTRIDNQIIDAFEYDIHSYWIFKNIFNKIYSSETNQNSVYNIIIELVSSVNFAEIKEKTYTFIELFDCINDLIPNIVSENLMDEIINNIEENPFNIREYMLSINNKFVCIMAGFTLMQMFLPSLYVQIFILEAELKKIIKTNSDKKISMQIAQKEIKFIELLFMKNLIPHFEKELPTNTTISKQKIKAFIEQITTLNCLTMQNMNSPQRKIYL